MGSTWRKVDVAPIYTGYRPRTNRLPKLSIHTSRTTFTSSVATYFVAVAYLMTFMRWLSIARFFGNRSLSFQGDVMNQNHVSFLKTDDEFGGLSNMAGGFPLLVNGVRVLTSEHLYQSLKFSNNPEIQKAVLNRARESGQISTFCVNRISVRLCVYRRNLSSSRKHCHFEFSGQILSRA